MSTNAAETEVKEIEVVEEKEEDTSSEVEVVEEEQQQEEKGEEAEAKEEELEQYSKSVQNRINKLTSRYREEEQRTKKAVAYAETIQKQNEELKQRLESLDQSYVGEFDTRIKSQVEAAKQAYQKAYDEGDADGMGAQGGFREGCGRSVALYVRRKKQERLHPAGSKESLCARRLFSLFETVTAL